MSTVLVVDDSKTSRTMLRNILVANGYEVIGEAENGQEGYDKYCELEPDFVTLDITMPVMDGIETLVKIKEYVWKTESFQYAFSSFQWSFLIMSACVHTFICSCWYCTCICICT